MAFTKIENGVYEYAGTQGIYHIIPSDYKVGEYDVTLDGQPQAVTCETLEAAKMSIIETEVSAVGTRGIE